MNFQNLFSLLLGLALFFGTPLHAKKKNAPAKKDFSIAQEITQLVKTNDKYKYWILTEDFRKDESFYKVAAATSQELLKQAYNPKEVEILVPSLEETGAILPLTEQQAPQLHKTIKKLCLIFYAAMPLVTLSQDKHYPPRLLHSDSQTYALILSYDDLTSYSDIIIEALIAHELTHLKESHVFKRIAYLKSHDYQKDNEYYALSRQHEMEADLIGLAALGSPDHYKAMIAWLKDRIRLILDAKKKMLKSYARQIKKNKQPESVNTLIKLCDDVLKEHASGADSHPSHKERIAYLEKALAELEKKNQALIIRRGACNAASLIRLTQA